MKIALSAIALVVLALIAGTTSCFVSSYVYRCEFCRDPDPNDRSSWLKEEFHLSDAQYYEVKRLQSDYDPHCAQMCQEMRNAEATLLSAISSNPVYSPAVQNALDHEEEARRMCHAAMLRHVYDVSQAMPPEEAKRYLQMMAQDLSSSRTITGK